MLDSQVEILENQSLHLDMFQNIKIWHQIHLVGFFKQSGQNLIFIHLSL